MGTSKQPRQGRTTVIEAIDNATALMMTLEDRTERMTEESMSITSMAGRGERAIENGNLRLAAEIFSDVRRASEQQRVLLAGMQSVTASARAALAMARRGEYGGEG